MSVIRRRVGAGLWASAGLLAGHELTYRLVYSDAQARDHALEHSGHGWTSLATPLLIVFIAGAVAATIIDARRSHSAHHAPNRRSALAIQAGFQVGAFLLVETAERLVHSGSLDQLYHDLLNHNGLLIMALGAAVQLLCAAAAGLLTSGIKALVRRSRNRYTTTADTVYTGKPTSTVFSLWCGFTRLGRAPPLEGNRSAVYLIAPRIH